MSQFEAAAPETPSASARPSPPRLSALRVLQWSIRRELWENRSIFIAPAAIAGLVLVGYLIGSLNGSHIHIEGVDPTHLEHLSEIPYYVAAASILAISVIVAAFYCLGALHTERRDRSILFWKALPVSDLVAVLAKASIPLVVTPVVALVITLVTQAVMLIISIIFILARGGDVAPILAHNPAFSNVWILPYGLAVLSLWYAPLYAWLLLASAWARRTPILWAAGPIIALPLVERLAFGTTYLGAALRDRFQGGFVDAFGTSATSHPDFSHPDPVGFASTPDLWVGLLLAAVFLFGAVWLRRRGEPI
jgi:ABC-2 type transport system permease protein